jgi:hypothetical protein
VSSVASLIASSGLEVGICGALNAELCIAGKAVYFPVLPCTYTPGHMLHDLLQIAQYCDQC